MTIAPYARALPIMSGAALTTFMLFFLMQNLVRNDGLQLIDDAPHRLFEGFIQDTEVRPVRDIDRLAPPPPVVEMEPIEIDRTPRDSGLESDIGVPPFEPVRVKGESVLRPKAPVAITIDPSAHTGAFVRLHDEARKAGMPNERIAVLVK